MTIVTVQVGQCGNAVGGALWEVVEAELRAASPSESTAARGKRREGASSASSGSRRPSRGASGSGYTPRDFAHLVRRTAAGETRARCVLVDTEPKVVQALCRGPCGRLFESRQCIKGNSGCANNWAHGYYLQQPKRETIPKSCLIEHIPMLQRVMDAIEFEVDKCPHAAEFLVIHSIAGGSGSGLGSRILEELRRQYPDNCILTASVAPSLIGDTPVQSLNACMSLRWLQDHADGVLLFRNDSIIDTISKRAAVRSGSSSAAMGAVSFDDINRHIARAIAGVVLPEMGISGSDPSNEAHLPLHSLVEHVCPEAGMKFLEAHHVCSSSSSARGIPSWTDVARLLGSAVDRVDAQDGNRTVQSSGTVAIAWGADPSDAETIAAAFIKSGGCPHVKWRSDPIQIHTRRLYPSALTRGVKASDGRAGSGRLRTAPAIGEGKGLTVFTNRSAVVGLFRRHAAAAMELCRARAFVHWYERYGCRCAALQDGAQKTEDIADRYATYFHD